MTTSTETDAMVERVARAIYESQFVDEWAGGHGAEADLFRHCARAAIDSTGIGELVEALREARQIVQDERTCTIECATIGPEHDPATLDADTRPYVEKYERVLAKIDAALAKVGSQTTEPLPEPQVGGSR